MMLFHAAVNVAFAAPVLYSFSTGPVLPFGFGVGASFISGVLSGSSVSGTFNYDAQAAVTSTNADGSVQYGRATGSFTGLSGTVAGLNFSDPKGSTQVGNDTFTFPITLTKADILQFAADPALTNPAVHDLTGFNIGGAYTLVNARLFWIETQLIAGSPGPIPDFLSNQSLPAAPPLFRGRLALDFVPFGNTNPTTPISAVFFDGLSVSATPEPETYALLLAGLGLLGFVARRRKQQNAAA